MGLFGDIVPKTVENFRCVKGAGCVGGRVWSRQHPMAHLASSTMTYNLYASSHTTIPAGHCALARRAPASLASPCRTRAPSSTASSPSSCCRAVTSQSEWGRSVFVKQAHSLQKWLNNIQQPPYTGFVVPCRRWCMHLHTVAAGIWTCLHCSNHQLPPYGVHACMHAWANLRAHMVGAAALHTYIGVMLTLSRHLHPIHTTSHPFRIGPTALVASPSMARSLRWVLRVTGSLSACSPTSVLWRCCCDAH